MKKMLASVCALLSMNAFLAHADETTAEDLLQKMSEATQTLNYELSYILIRKNSIEPLLYRHSVDDKTQLAHLVYLSGPYREVIRRGDEVSYRETGVEPFSIHSGKMVAPIMPILGTDIEQLHKYYDYINVGRAREAGATSQVLRIVPKDGLRYSYVLWIDDTHYLPLRADLVDRDGEVLEQYRTITFAVNPKLAQLMQPLSSVELPPVLAMPKGQSAKTHWHVNWIPDGFTAQKVSRYRLNDTQQQVESQIYSDGLFNFSVYVAKRDEHSLRGQYIRQGRRTLHSMVIGHHQVSVVGDIPPTTAQRIAQSVVFDQQGDQQ
ncbi:MULTISPECIES: sigma-E factor regulatory protein RseB [unclassified Vibrio]|uniref:Sigma-E factor regulatory protein RseB n=1 Tax=Vibrio sp. HB236076 TaxID=3232307 RepID=A0AB39HEN0_9VIBR|nr:sigma-E factor regulatory protein RseB [Vibrio sp. HB161653]MDP5253950.1 sigma-E factor regulatory protein RseB [Vibrio sp. HB161653]